MPIQWARSIAHCNTHAYAGHGPFCHCCLDVGLLRCCGRWCKTRPSEAKLILLRACAPALASTCSRLTWFPVGCISLSPWARQWLMFATTADRAWRAKVLCSLQGRRPNRAPTSVPCSCPGHWQCAWCVVFVDQRARSGCVHFRHVATCRHTHLPTWVHVYDCDRSGLNPTCGVLLCAVLNASSVCCGGLPAALLCTRSHLAVCVAASPAFNDFSRPSQWPHALIDQRKRLRVLAGSACLLALPEVSRRRLAFDSAGRVCTAYAHGATWLTFEVHF